MPDHGHEPPHDHMFTACFVLVQGGPSQGRIINEIRRYIEFSAARSPLSHGPILAVDILCRSGLLSEAVAGGEIAQMLGRLPCGAIVEWVVPRRDSVRAFGMYASWDGMKDHPDVVSLDRGSAP